MSYNSCGKLASKIEMKVTVDESPFKRIECLVLGEERYLRFIDRERCILGFLRRLYLNVEIPEKACLLLFLANFISQLLNDPPLLVRAPLLLL